MSENGLAVALLACLLLAGCSGLSPAETPGQELVTVTGDRCGDADLTPPTDPNATTAAAFAVRCEVSRVLDPDTVFLRRASLLTRIGSRFYVRVRVVVGTETPPATAVYAVGNATYQRLSRRDVWVGADADSAGAVSQTVYLLNDDETGRELRVRFTHRPGDDRRVVLNWSDAVAGHSARVLHADDLPTGPTRVAIDAGGRRLAIHRYGLTERAGPLVAVVGGPNGTNIAAVPDGDQPSSRRPHSAAATRRIDPAMAAPPRRGSSVVSPARSS